MKKERSLKRLLLCLMMVILLAIGLSIVCGEKAQAATATKNISGKYLYQSKTVLLNRMNAIRKEACDEGVRDPRNTSRNLTASDYVPIQWSKSLEEICKTRAGELNVQYGHTRPNGKICFTAKASDGSQSYAENIAGATYGENSAMLNAINLFYSEKKDWVNQTGKKTGHYTSIINPDYKYTALSAFKSHGGTWLYVANEFAYDNISGNTQLVTKTTSAIVPVEVPAVSMTGVKISLTSRTLTTGSSFKIIAARIPSNTTDQTVIQWKTSNAKVATVSSNGVVTAKEKGTATITAICGNKKASCKVTVQPKNIVLTKITITPTTKAINVGGTYKFIAKKIPVNTTNKNNIIWKSSNTKIAIVDANGKVKAVKAGTATITATCSGKSATAKITVVKPRIVKFIVLKSKPKKSNYYQGQNLNVTGGILNVRWSDGKTTDVGMTPKMCSGYNKNKLGSQKITVTYGGKKISFTINVKKDIIAAISVKQQPTKTVYVRGENLNVTGGIINAKWISGKTTAVNLTTKMCTGYNKNKLGNQKITVTYNGKKTSFTAVNKEKVKYYDKSKLNIKDGYAVPKEIKVHVGQATTVELIKLSNNKVYENLAWGGGQAGIGYTYNCDNNFGSFWNQGQKCVIKGLEPGIYEGNVTVEKMNNKFNKNYNYKQIGSRIYLTYKIVVVSNAKARLQ